MSFAPREYRDTVGLFATGVAVVACDVGHTLHAITANSVTSLSLDPPLMLFCPAKKAKLAAFVDSIKSFSINFLYADQEALASYFAGAWHGSTTPPHRFVPWGSAQRLEGCLAALDCELHQVLDGGDHWIVIGRVTGLHRGVAPHWPLLFFGGRFRNLDAAHSTPAPDLSEVIDETAQIFYHY